MDERTTQLLAAVRGGASCGEDVRTAWKDLFALDPVLATSAAFDLLAGEPRIKPSRHLVVDPGDSVRVRWNLRVAAAAALLASPVAPELFDELRDELAEDLDLATDVLTAAVPCSALSVEQVDALSRCPVLPR